MLGVSNRQGMDETRQKKFKLMQRAWKMKEI